jgi:hypothetical protein
MMPDRRFNSTIMQWLWNRTHKHNQNGVVGIFGPTGSGKSYSALRICSELDPAFSADRVVFDARSFLNLLNHGNLKRGDCILWDEGGVGLGNRNWQSQNNKAVCEVLQTFRIDNLTLLFSAPDFKFLDAGARRMFHLMLVTKYIDRIQKQTVLKPFVCTYDVRQSRPYFKYPVKFVHGAPAQVDCLRVGLPRKELIDAYEVKKRAFVTALNLRLERNFESQDNDEKSKKRPDVEALALQVVAEPGKFVQTYKGRSFVSLDMVASKLGVGGSFARRVKGIAESRLREAGNL